MVVVYAVTPEMREKFKEPFGLLLRGTFSETTKQLTSVVNREMPSKVIAVGDIVSKNLHEHGIDVHLSITDDKSLRRRIQPVVLEAKKVLHVKNPRGTITEEAITAVREALRSKEHTHILVDGEEDLLTLIAVLYAPEDAVVVYGQPYEGVVVVKVTAAKRSEAEKLLEAMSCSKTK
jgi:hypothetical protein